MQVRQVQANEMKEAIEQADRTFRSSEQSSMGTAFPQIFNSSIRHSFGAFEEGKMLAFMGLVPNVIRLGASMIHVYCLGSVYTVQEAQGSGIASQLLNEVMRFLRQTGASIMLVSGDRSLYTRIGCMRFGQIREYTITSKQENASYLEKENTPVRYRLFHETDWFQFYELARTKEIAYESSMYDLAQLIESESYANQPRQFHEIYVAEIEGRLIAAILIVLSEELECRAEPFVVSWYGLASEAVSLIYHVMKERRRPQVKLRVSWYETELQHALEGNAYQTLQNAGTIKIIDVQRLWHQVAAFLQQKDADASNAIRLLKEEVPDQVSLSVCGELVTLSLRQFTDLLFTPGVQIDELIPYQDIVKRLFPIAYPDTSGLHFI